MAVHQSAEDYLETIYVLSERNGEVRSIDVANELGFSKPSVSVAMKKLRMENLIAIDEKGFISLTEQGKVIAGRTYERHVFLAQWLISLGVEKQTAEDDACKIEHVISADSFDKIREYVKRTGDIK